MTKITYYNDETGARKAKVTTINGENEVVETILDPSEVIEDPGFGPALTLDAGVEWVPSSEYMSYEADGGPLLGAPE